jgi:hypothetical protein
VTLSSSDSFTSYGGDGLLDVGIEQLALDFTAAPAEPLLSVRPDRSRRHMPPMVAIERHWDLPHGYCARCKQPARCEKAHIIDRCHGGLDGPQNLVPLCYPCHSDQPSYEPGDEPFALEWIFHNRPTFGDSTVIFEDVPVRFLAAMIWLRVANNIDEANSWLTERRRSQTP